MHYLNCTCPKCQMSGGLERESPFSEAEEIELAAELLDLFPGKL